MNKLILLLVLALVIPALAWDGICPNCKKEGKRSTVTEGAAMGTLLGWTTTYDEKGERHSDNPNSFTTGYTCSSGHKFSIIRHAKGEETILNTNAVSHVGAECTNVLEKAKESMDLIQGGVTNLTVNNLTVYDVVVTNMASNITNPLAEPYFSISSDGVVHVERDIILRGKSLAYEISGIWTCLILLAIAIIGITYFKK